MDMSRNFAHTIVSIVGFNGLKLGKARPPQVSRKEAVATPVEGTETARVSLVEAYNIRKEHQGLFLLVVRIDIVAIVSSPKMVGLLFQMASWEAFDLNLHSRTTQNAECGA